MRKVIIVFTLLLLSKMIVGQNLVPNGDFEFYTSCPTGGGQINFAFPWHDPNNTSSDYYNACAPENLDISTPCQGLTCQYFQVAHSGVAYSGFYAYNGINGREYIQIKLTDTLNANVCYDVEFHINLSNLARFGVNNIGAYLSNTAVTCPFGIPYNLTPQILLPGNPPIIDTVNWVSVHGTYQANGGEQYLTIGNFAYDSSTTKQIIDTVLITSNNFAYYYIDDVSLIGCEGNGIANYTTPLITIFPTQ